MAHYDKCLVFRHNTSQGVPILFDVLSNIFFISFSRRKQSNRFRVTWGCRYGEVHTVLGDGVFWMAAAGWDMTCRHDIVWVSNSCQTETCWERGRISQPAKPMTLSQKHQHGPWPTAEKWSYSQAWLPRERVGHTTTTHTRSVFCEKKNKNTQLDLDTAIWKQLYLFANYCCYVWRKQIQLHKQQ